MTEDQKDTDDLESQLSLISVSKRWWHVCVILLCVQTLGWMAFTWWGIKNNAGSYREIIEAMVYGSSRAIPLFIVLSITVPLVAEFIGGFIVVLAQYLIRKFEKRGEERGIEQGIEIGEERGIETGRELERVAWLTWYKNMKDAEARGEPFDEPPPSMGNGSSPED
jgi:hypothetical protein